MKNLLTYIPWKSATLLSLLTLFGLSLSAQLRLGISYGLANPAWPEGNGQGMAVSFRTEYPLMDGLFHVWGQVSGGRMFFENFFPEDDFVAIPDNPYNSYYFDGFQFVPVYVYNRTLFGELMAGVSIRPMGITYAAGGWFTPYADVGLGLNSYHASLDLLDEAGRPYDFENPIILGPNGTFIGFYEYQWRSSQRDGTYETPAAGHATQTNIFHHKYQLMWLMRIGVNVRLTRGVHLDGFLSANTNTRSNRNVAGRRGHAHGQVLDRYFRAGFGITYSL